MQFTRSVTVDIAPTELGEALAELDSDEQAEFFVAFVEELFECCGGEANAQLQLAHVLDHLSPAQREVLSILAHNGEPAS